MSFWKSASEEQKMAQVLGGIECGMTDKQIGMCLQISRSTIGGFIVSHGIKRNSQEEVERLRSLGGRMSGKTAGILKMRKLNSAEINRSDAFRIFEDVDDDRRSMLDWHQND